MSQTSVFWIIGYTGRVMEGTNFLQVLVNIPEQELPASRQFVQERSGEIKMVKAAVDTTGNDGTRLFVHYFDLYLLILLLSGFKFTFSMQ